MMLLTIITQIFILVKNALLASYFGVSAELDAFNLSNRTSTFVYSFIGAGISTVIIPYLKEKINKNAVDIFISVIYSFSFLLLVLMIIFRDQIIYIMSGSDDAFFLEMASNIFVFTVISGFLNSLIQSTKAILEYKGQFNRQKLIVLFITVLLVTLLWLGNDSIYYYALILFVTTFVNIILHVYFLKKSKYKYNLNYDLKNDGFHEMIKLYIPTLLSTGVYQISLLIDTMIAARLDVGSISILNYSNSVIVMINMLLLGNLTAFVYPKLVKNSSESGRQETLVQYILFTNVIMCLIFILFYSSGRQGVSILFERGEFNRENTNIVYSCALILAVALPFNGIRDLLYRYFYINKDTYTPFVNSIVISVINIIVSIILSKYIGLYGVVIGTVVASFLSLIFISVKFRNKFTIYFNKKFTLVENLKVVFVTLLTTGSLLLLKKIIVIQNIFIGLGAYAAISVLIFIILLKAFKSKVFKINL
jgi:putative peptidoglycan lipid II flippase